MRLHYDVLFSERVRLLRLKPDEPLVQAFAREPWLVEATDLEEPPPLTELERLMIGPPVQLDIWAGQPMEGSPHHVHYLLANMRAWTPYVYVLGDPEIIVDCLVAFSDQFFARNPKHEHMFFIAEHPVDDDAHEALAEEAWYEWDENPYVDGAQHACYVLRRNAWIREVWKRHPGTQPT